MSQTNKLTGLIMSLANCCIHHPHALSHHQTSSTPSTVTTRHRASALGDTKGLKSIASTPIRPRQAPLHNTHLDQTPTPMPPLRYCPSATVRKSFSQEDKCHLSSWNNVPPAITMSPNMEVLHHPPSPGYLSSRHMSPTYSRDA